MRRFTAGRLSFELEDGAVRYVQVDGVEVLRGIAFLVRDPHWATLAATTEELSVTEVHGRVTLAWGARVDGFTWTARIEAGSDGLAFTAEGVATATLQANRVGFVVLHPIEAFAGTTIEIEHTDGSREVVEMPGAIAPHQPAFDIAALTHRVAGLAVRVEVAGDAFEMEDQRNWTDASFKTYVRPLSRPRPFTLRAGETVSQSVRLSVVGTTSAVVSVSQPQPGRMPEIALTADAADLPSLAAALDLLRPGWLHLRVDAAVPDAVMLNLPVLLDIDARSADHLQAFADVPAAAVVVCGDAPGLLDAARAAFAGVPVGVGVRSHFTELNRARPPADVAVLVHTTSAIVHAADDRTVVETLDALPHVFAAARALAPDAAYRPGPCTIGDAAGPAANPHGGRVPSTRRDPRHAALFAAAWAVGLLAVAARGGVASISLGTASGDFSLLEARAPTPLGHLARAVSAIAGRAVTAGRDRIEGDGFQLWANLTADTVPLEGAAEALGPNGWQAAQALGPYGVARSVPWPQ